jgi:hypothetical protein
MWAEDQRAHGVALADMQRQVSQLGHVRSQLLASHNECDKWKLKYRDLKEKGRQHIDELRAVHEENMRRARATYLRCNPNHATLLWAMHHMARLACEQFTNVCQLATMSKELAFTGADLGFLKRRTAASLAALSVDVQSALRVCLPTAWAPSAERRDFATIPTSQLVLLPGASTADRANSAARRGRSTTAAPAATIHDARARRLASPAAATRVVHAVVGGSSAPTSRGPSPASANRAVATAGASSSSVTRSAAAATSRFATSPAPAVRRDHRQEVPNAAHTRGLVRTRTGRAPSPLFSSVAPGGSRANSATARASAAGSSRIADGDSARRPVGPKNASSPISDARRGVATDGSPKLPASPSAAGGGMSRDAAAAAVAAVAAAGTTAASSRRGGASSKALQAEKEPEVPSLPIRSAPAMAVEDLDDEDW